MAFMAVNIGNTTIFGSKDSNEKYITAIKVNKDYDVNVSFKFMSELSCQNFQEDRFITWEMSKHYIRKNGKHYRGIGE